MPYREKVAWLSLLALLCSFGPYFTLVATGFFPVKPLPDFFQLLCYGITALVQLTILAVGHLLLRRINRQEARLAEDERDIQMRQRATGLAYGVLMTGIILTGVIMPFYTGGWQIVNSSLFMIVLAQLLVYVSLVLQYRRQSA